MSLAISVKSKDNSKSGWADSGARRLLCLLPLILHIDLNRELLIEIPNRSQIKSCLAEWTSSLVLTPFLDTVCMVVMPYITRQNRHLVVLPKLLQTDDALFQVSELKRVKVTRHDPKLLSLSLSLILASPAAPRCTVTQIDAAAEE